MNMSEFAFNLLLVFFPGILCAYIVDLLNVRRERPQFQFIVNSFVLGVISYLIYAVWVSVCSSDDPSSIYFFGAGVESQSPESLKEILYVTAISVILAIVLVFIDRYKLHFRIFYRIGITKRFGEQDVWGFLMNSPDTEWVTVRDIENNLMYSGYVKVFSSNFREAELLLESVTVYKNDTEEKLYEVRAQYLSFKKDSISIEVQTQPTGVDHVREKS